MSAEATGWVYRHSPYTGAGFSVHLAIADSVNDQHDNEFWMATGNLAVKARISRSTATTAVAVLVGDGYLERLDPPGEPARQGRPVRYRFLMPDTAPNVYEPSARRRAERAKGDRPPVTPQTAEGDRPPVTGARSSKAEVTDYRSLTQEITQAEPNSSAGDADGPVSHETSDDEIAARTAQRSAAGKALNATQRNRPRRRTPRDDLFDALVAAFGPASTPSRSAFYGRTVNELVQADATPAQVQAARIAMSRRGWDSPTPTAMVKHWDELLADSAPTNPAASRFWEPA